jgi:SAM-dependent methyltransferase
MSPTFWQRKGPAQHAFAAVGACFGGISLEFPGIYTHPAPKQSRRRLSIAQRAQVKHIPLGTSGGFGKGRVVTSDWRADVAEFYDLGPHHPDDIPFYLAHLPGPSASVLELGCGTGRVTIPLANGASFVQGLDNSEAMIARCRRKLEEQGIGPDKAEVGVRDITRFSLDQTFDLIVAPFRVIQNLATEAEVEGLFDCIRRHLSPRGTCILNVFNPKSDRETLVQGWVSTDENLAWEVNDGDTVVRCYDLRKRLQEHPLVVFPELVYRRYRNEEPIGEAVLRIAMRCYYPQEFLDLIEGNGFRVTGKWGGYAGEQYGTGPKLVVAFKDGV